jgi:hypothetical protein
VNQTTGRSRVDALPRWARWCDVLGLAGAAIGAWIASYGAIIYRSEDVSFTARSPYRAWVLAVVLIAIRHYRYPSPSLPARVWRGVRDGVLALVPDVAVPNTRSVIQLAIATRVAIMIVGILANVSIGYPEGPPPFGISANVFLNVHARWDAAWYSEIALFGYEWMPHSAHEQSIAFFPGYPILMNVAGNVLSVAEYLVGAPGVLGGPQGRMVLGGLLVSLAAFALALLHLKALAGMFAGEERTRAVLVLLAAYPFAVYFSAPLTESTFLLAVVAAFYSAEAQRFGRMTFWSLLAGLVRPNGFVLTPALLLLVAQRMWSGRSASGEPYRRGLLPFVATFGAMAAMLAYSWYVRDLTGDPFAWAKAQGGWALQARPPWTFFTGRVAQWYELGTYGFSLAHPLELLKLACVSITLVLSVLAGRFGIAYAVWPLLSIAPALALDLPAIGRMTAVLFPAFLALGRFAPSRWHPPVVVLFALFQGFLATLFYTSRPPW